MDKYKYTSKDYQSILKELIEISPELSQAYDPQSENDPMTVGLKNIALMGDMLSFYLDKTALETAPATMTQRKVADAYYRMMGYYMDWYRPCSIEVTVTNSHNQAIKIPKYTTFLSIDRTVSAVLLEDKIIPAAIPGGSLGEAIITLYEGKVNTEYAVSISGVEYQLSALSKTIMIDSTQVVDASGSVWTRVEDINKESLLGKYYDVYPNEIDNIIIRFSPYLESAISPINSITYLYSAGAGSSILSAAMIDAIIIPPNDNQMDSDLLSALNVSKSGSSTQATLGPETPQEAYINAQKYINTSDTLITCKDYENAIKRSSYISNCKVIDKKLALEIDPSWYGLKEDGTPKNDDSEFSNADYVVLYVPRDYDYTNSSTILQEVKNEVSENKQVNLTENISTKYFVMDWQPKGTITLSESVSEDEANNLLNSICTYLATNYSPSMIEFGQRISLVDLINNIKAYDDRLYIYS